MMNSVILVLGITGGIGRAFAKKAADQGWTIRAMHRQPQSARAKLSEISNIEWIAGDAMNGDDVLRAAKGVDVIFHGLNPPGYKNWRGLAMPMLENAIRAAIAAKARLVFPGNVYNFGPDAWPLIGENTPQNPSTKKGRVRVEMEEMLRHATQKGARVLIVRAGDFFGPNAVGSWFANGIVKPGKRLKSVTYPGQHNVGHNWAYLPDLAATMVQLLARQDDLAAFEVFHFGGHYFPRGVTIAEETLVVGGIADGQIKNMPWGLLKALSPFVATLRELMEMRYLWSEDVRLDNSKLKAFLGAEPHTPTNVALKQTLQSLKCL